MVGTHRPATERADFQQLLHTWGRYPNLQHCLRLQNPKCKVGKQNRNEYKRWGEISPQLNHHICAKLIDIFIQNDSTCSTSCHDQKRYKRKKICPESHVQLKRIELSAQTARNPISNRSAEFYSCSFTWLCASRITQKNCKLVTAFVELQSSDALYNPVNTAVLLKLRCTIFTIAAVRSVSDSWAGLHLIQMKKTF